VDAARRKVWGEMAVYFSPILGGPRRLPSVEREFDAFEAAVRADEYRRIMDAGTDADAWGEAGR
jgi:hypothetical protein